MRRFIITVLITATAAAQAQTAQMRLDGKRPMFCTAVQMYQCDLTYGCFQVTADEIGAASSWNIDFKKKLLTPTKRGAAPNPIQHSEVLDGKIFMTSVQDGSPDEIDGVAWSVSINAVDGLMTFAVVGDGVGFVGLGSCVPT